jgi:hypothetical protein
MCFSPYLLCRKIVYGAVTGPNGLKTWPRYETALVQGDSIFLSGGMRSVDASEPNSQSEQKIIPFRAPDGKTYIDNLGSYIKDGPNSPECGAPTSEPNSQSEQKRKISISNGKTYLDNLGSYIKDFPLEIEIAHCMGASVVWQRSEDDVRLQKAKRAHLVLKEEWACNWNATKFKTTAGAVEVDQKTANETLVYHFTTSQAAHSILLAGASGFRMSTQGQGDGGVYFSKLGPQGKGKT